MKHHEATTACSACRVRRQCHRLSWCGATPVHGESESGGGAAIFTSSVPTTRNRHQPPTRTAVAADARSIPSPLEVLLQVVDWPRSGTDNPRTISACAPRQYQRSKRGVGLGWRKLRCCIVGGLLGSAWSGSLRRHAEVGPVDGRSWYSDACGRGAAAPWGSGSSCGLVGIYVRCSRGVVPCASRLGFARALSAQEIRGCDAEIRVGYTASDSLLASLCCGLCGHNRGLRCVRPLVSRDAPAVCLARRRFRERRSRDSQAHPRL